jgi:ribosomal protein L7/L12
MYARLDGGVDGELIVGDPANGQGAIRMSYPEQDIRELRERVARLECQIAFLMEHLGVEYHEERIQGVSPEVMDLVRSGRKIQAIRLFRQETGAGLKDAKAFIESLEP